ncbi:MAG: hypothetical protein HRF49_07055 [bacterium]|jgi:hypothetical protein
MDYFWEYAEVYASFYKNAFSVRVQFPDGSHTISTPDSTLVILNELGRDGWELAGLIGRGRRGDEGEFGQIYYMKRQVKKKPTMESYGPLRGAR